MTQSLLCLSFDIFHLLNSLLDIILDQNAITHPLVLYYFVKLYVHSLQKSQNHSAAERLQLIWIVKYQRNLRKYIEVLIN